MATNPKVEPAPRSRALSLEDVKRFQPRERPLTFRVRGDCRTGDSIDQEGIRVGIGQIVYGQSGLRDSGALLDGRLEVQSPVATTTNAHYAATLTGVDVQSQVVPMNLQAWVIRAGQPSTSYVTAPWAQYTGGW